MQKKMKVNLFLLKLLKCLIDVLKDECNKNYFIIIHSSPLKC